MVELHGGTISAHSDGVGKGSEFVVRLPLLSREIAPHAASKPDYPARKTALVRRILIVDDLREGADSLGAMLRALGHEVRVAPDGPTGVALAGETAPDVVLLDIGLPGLDGYEVARRVRALAGDRPVRIVAVTGYGQPEDRRRAFEAGFDAHVVKPVSAELLNQVIAGLP